MFDLSLLPVVLRAWLEYLRLEDLANAEVDKGAGHYQSVFDQDVQIVGNKVRLGRPLFDRLKQMYRRACDRGHPEEAQIALALPALYRVRGKGENQRLKYYPLFSIDLSWILQGGYREVGWDLLECSFYPVAANLVEFCRLEEPALDALVVSEGILRFLRDVFRRPFATLQDFLNQVDLPSGCKADRTAYVVQASLTAYNTQLKQDLRSIYQQFFKTAIDRRWLKNHYPTTLYLRGSLSPPRHAALFWAAFPGKIPDEFQAQAIKHAQGNQLTAVFGGPGSGKTELLLHLLTQPIYERAKAIAHDQPDRNSLCVFASTNIDKFQHRLHSRFPNHLFYLPGGNRRDIIPNQTLPKLRAAADWLQTQTFDAAHYAQLKTAFTQAEAELRQKLEDEPELQRRRSADAALLAQIEADLEGLQTVAQMGGSTTSEDSPLATFPIEAYRQIKLALEQAQAELSHKKSPRCLGTPCL